MSWFCQQMIVLWPAFLRSWFLSSRAERNEILGDEFEHRIEQGLLLAWHASQGFEARAPVPKGIDCAFETDPGEIDLMPDSRLLHQRADQVVGNRVECIMTSFSTIAGVWQRSTSMPRVILISRK